MSGPTKKIRVGQISCALWKNNINVDGQAKTVMKATIERRYKDNDGQWKSSGSYSRSEIPMVIVCMIKAYAAMLQQPEDDNLGPVVEEAVA